MENSSQPVCDFVSSYANTRPEYSVPRNIATTACHGNQSTTWLVGIPGSGKMQLARQYVSEMRSVNDSQAFVFWVDAHDDPASALLAELRGEYLQNMVKDPISGSQFFPRSAIDRIFTSDLVLAALAQISENSSNQGQFLENITNPRQSGGSFSAIFAILVMIGKAHNIKSFVDEGLNDNSLPFVFERNKSGEFDAFDPNNPHRIHEFSRCWSSDEVHEFKKAQQSVVLPVFDVANVLSGKRPIPHLGSCEVLPFTKANRVQSGGTSVVYNISIHEDNYTTENNTVRGLVLTRQPSNSANLRHNRVQAVSP
jgi:hypothetical protein